MNIFGKNGLDSELTKNDSTIIEEEASPHSTQRPPKFIQPQPPSCPVYLCNCLLDDDNDNVEISARQHRILTTVFRTEEYLRMRRIPELIRFLLTKVLAHRPDEPLEFLEQLLNECMLFRAGHGPPPLLYEDR